MKISTRRITTMGLLIALSIILTRVFSLRIAIGGVEGVRIGLGKFPIIFGGIIFGPLAGGIIGALSDLLGYFIIPMGPYLPQITLTYALSGIIPVSALILMKDDKPNVLKLGIAIAIGQIITSMMISYFLSILNNYSWVESWTVLILPRIIAEPIHIFTYTYIINIILKKNILVESSIKI